MVESGHDSNGVPHTFLVDSSGRPIVTKEGAYTKIRKFVSLGDTNETTIWDPTAGTKFVITDLILSATATGLCTLRDGTAGTTFMILRVGSSFPAIANLHTPVESSTADNILTAQASAAAQYVFVAGYEI